MKKIVLMVVALMSVAFVQAQSVVDNYNAAAKAVEAKDFAKAAELYETVITDGSEEEDATILGCVENAKKNLPVMYVYMGKLAAGAATKLEDPKAKDAKFAEAIAVLEKAVSKAKSYRNTKAATTATTTIGQVYKAHGGPYFNNGDYAKAIEIFSKGYAANNKIATMQQANDFDGIIAMSETIADKALAQKVLVQAYFLKKDYAKVIEIGEAAAALQTDEESKSAVYFNLGSAYNAKENKAKAIECLSKVTVEPYATPAKAAVAELSK